MKFAIPIPPVMQRGCKVHLTRNLGDSFCGISPDHKVPREEGNTEEAAYPH